MREILYSLLNLIFYTAFMCCSSRLVFASEGSAHNGDGSQWLWPIVNFTILFVVLFIFLKKPLQSFLRNRSESIGKSLNDAREAKGIAEKALEGVEQKLKLKDEEIERIIRSARQSGEEERGRLIEEGKAMSKRIKEQSEKNIAFELKKAKEEIKAEAIEIAMELTEKKLKDSITKEEQQKILKEAVNKLETV